MIIFSHGKTELKLSGKHLQRCTILKFDKSFNPATKLQAISDVCLVVSRSFPEQLFPSISTDVTFKTKLLNVTLTAMILPECTVCQKSQQTPTRAIAKLYYWKLRHHFTNAAYFILTLLPD